MANILEYRCFAMVRNFVYLVIFLGILMKQRIPAFQLVTENDYVLVDHVFRQFYARDWFNCIQACHDEPRCISYNYQTSAGTSGLCELNECGAEDLCDRKKSLIYSLGFVFQKIRQNEASNVSIPNIVKETLNLKPQGVQVNQVRCEKCCSLEIFLFSSNIFIYNAA